MRNPESLREQARKLMAEAARLEKKKRQDSLAKAGEIVEGYFKSNFANFNPDTFKDEIKKIFSGADATVRKSKKTATAKPPQPHHETAEQKDESAQKKSWFK